MPVQKSPKKKKSKKQTPRKSKKERPPAPPSSNAKPKPIKWYTFYSEKYGREYYYEENSKVVTWIRPDDAHPFGTATPPSKTAPSAVSSSPRGLDRRVSFHQGQQEEQPIASDRDVKLVVTEGDVFSKQREKGQSWYRYASTNKILLVLFVLMTLLCIVMWVQQERDVRAHKRMIEENEAIQLAKKIAKRIKTFEEEPPASAQEEAPAQTEPEATKIEAKDKVVPDRSAPALKDGIEKIMTVMRPEDKATGGIHNATRKKVEKVDKGCLVPFAYIVRKRCRVLAKEQPLVDINSIVDSMLQ